MPSFVRYSEGIRYSDGGDQKKLGSLNRHGELFELVLLNARPEPYDFGEAKVRQHITAIVPPIEVNGENLGLWETMTIEVGQPTTIQATGDKGSAAFSIQYE